MSKIVKMNPNLEQATRIIGKVIANDGYCPCRLQHIPSTLCPCEEYRTTSKCICGLYKEVDVDDK